MAIFADLPDELLLCIGKLLPKKSDLNAWSRTAQRFRGPAQHLLILRSVIVEPKGYKYISQTSLFLRMLLDRPELAPCVRSLNITVSSLGTGSQEEGYDVDSTIVSGQPLLTHLEFGVWSTCYPFPVVRMKEEEVAVMTLAILGTLGELMELKLKAVPDWYPEDKQTLGPDFCSTVLPRRVLKASPSMTFTVTW